MSTHKAIAALGIATALLTGTATPAHPHSPDTPPQEMPTVVLVHGAFEDATAFEGVTSRLQTAGYQVDAPAVPLRGIASDTAYLSSVLDTISGPIVLVGHSYAGFLVSALAAQNSNVKALVYVAAFIPQKGDTVAALNSQFPGSILGPDTSYNVDYPGGTDLYVRQESYRALYAADRTPGEALAAAAAQRPLDTRALTETATGQAPSDIPKFALVATQDRAVPAQAEQWEAERAGARIYRVCSAHDMAVSHPGTVAGVIETAAQSVENLTE